jgi:uncharacterized membrane protein
VQISRGWTACDRAVKLRAAGRWGTTRNQRETLDRTAVPPQPEDPSTPPPVAAAVPRRVQIRVLGILAAVIIAYTAVSQYSYSSPDAKGLGAGLSVGPVVAVGVALAWRWTPRFVAALITALTGALLYVCWPFLKAHYEWSDLVQQAGVYGMVAIGFGRSLLRGRIPTCTLLADQLHGPLEASETAYTRRATIVWFVFYTLLAAAIVVVFFTASTHVWSLFVNFGTFGLMGLLFAADHAIRRRVLPRRPGGGLVAALLHSVTGRR